MVIKLLDPMIEGAKVSLLVDGKEVKRKVYYRSYCGLFVVIHNVMIFNYDFYTDDTFTY